MPFSYAQYTGNGSTTTFSVPFPYLLKAHVKLYTGFNILDGTFTSQLVDGTDYTYTSGTQVQTTVAPATGVVLTVLRDTPDGTLLVPWQDGSNLIADDLNTSDLQNLYVVQEQQDRNDAGAAAAVAAEAAAATATTAAGVATTAATAATAASTAATSAAASAEAASAAATATSNTALTTAQGAASDAASALTASTAAATDAAAAVVTANAADGKADQALSAVATAILYDLVANVAAIPSSPANNDAVEVFDSTGIESFTPLAGKPSGFVGDSGLSVRIVYSATGNTWNWIQYFPNDPETRYGDAIVTLQGDVSDLQTDLGAAQSDILGLDSSKLDATTAASTYLTQTDAGTTYQPLSGMSSYLTTSDASSTYLTQSNASSTYQTQAGMSSYVATSDIGVTVQGYDADTVKTDVLPTFTVATRTTERTITSGAFDLATGNLWTVGAITVPNPTNAVAGQTGAIRITAGPVVWSGNFKFPGGVAPTIATFPAIIPYYVQGSSTILMGFVTEGVA